MLRGILRDLDPDQPRRPTGLRSDVRATSIRTMFRLSTSARRIVAGVAATLLLACQSTATVYASSIDIAGSDAARGSCHDAGQPAGKTANNNGCQANCQSQLTSSSSSSAGFLAGADLPAITTHIDRIIAVADSAPPAESPTLRVELPPLTILYCCLRN